jgi:hypothetical protein
MYRQTSEAVMQRKKKDGKKNKVSDEEYDGDNNIGREPHKKKGHRRKTDGEDGDEEAVDDSKGDGDDTSKNDDTEEKSDEPGNTAKCSLMDYGVMAGFLSKISLFFLFSIRKVSNNHTAATIIMIKFAHDTLVVHTKSVLV